CRRSRPGSYALPHSRRQNAELVAVLRDRAASDLNPLFLEEVNDLLVGERLGRILLANHLLQLGADGAGARVLAGCRSERTGEKELERKHAARGLHVL